MKNVLKIYLNRVELCFLIVLIIFLKKYWSFLKLGYLNFYLINKSNNELYNNIICILKMFSYE